MGVDTEYNNIYDLEDRYSALLHSHMRSVGTKVLNACIRFGVLSVRIRVQGLRVVSCLIFTGLKHDIVLRHKCEDDLYARVYV